MMTQIYAIFSPFLKYFLSKYLFFYKIVANHLCRFYAPPVVVAQPGGVRGYNPAP